MSAPSWALVVVFSLLAAYGWRTYMVGRVIVDDSSITQISAFKEIRLLWSEIGSFRKSKPNKSEDPTPAIVVSSKGKIRLSGFLNDVETLEAIIERRISERDNSG